MNDELVSPKVFTWFLTLIVGVVAAAWLAYDGYNLARARKRTRDPLEQDRRFGYLMGVVIGAVGIWGCLRYHGLV